jgi:hypothetical protein
MPTKIPPQDIQQALTALDVTEAELEAIRRAPFPKAQTLLQDLKAKAHRNYKRLALELHPDRTQGDKTKAELFVLLGRVLEEFDKIAVHPAPKPIQVVRVPIATWQAGWNNPWSTSPTSTTTGFTQVQVIRIVTMRPK